MYSQDYYNKKYLKYKHKYLQTKVLIENNTIKIKDFEIKNKQFGGGKPFNKLLYDKNINFFSDPEMSEYLNPIYGLFFCESGFISNNYFLKKNNLINTIQTKNINFIKIIKEIPSGITPTNDIMLFSPIDFGRYIAIKYIFLKNPHLITITKNNEPILNFSSNNISDINNIKKYINLLKSYFPLKSTLIETFYILLYCFWWIANDYNGILSYYEGINEVFTIINRCISISTLKNKPIPILKYNIIDTNNLTINNNFEKTILKITNKSFNIYNQEWSKHFCNIKNNKPLYPDCGEVTARNLINLMCFDGINIDISQLESFNPIPQLIEYYRVFNNYSLQSSTEPLAIFDDNLNARDAWSKLIIFYANLDLNFTKLCGDDYSYGYELNSGMNKKNSCSNFLQLIKNLLPGIDNLNKIKTKFIETVIDNTINGIGIISINCSVNNEEFEIECIPGHYYMKIINQKNDDLLDLINFNIIQQNYIKILFNKSDDITIDNYLWYNIDSNQLVDLLNSETLVDTNLKIELFKLSLTEKYDNDTRRRIINDTDDNYFMYILCEIKNNKNIQKTMNEYNYISKNFNFVNLMPYLTHLNFIIKNNEITHIDLKPLINIQSIGDNFLFNCSELLELDLKPLANIQSIGDNFLSNCSGLVQINFEALTNIQSIGNNYLYNCSGLMQINFEALTNIQSIGNYFLYNCSGLTNINLSLLSKIKSIGDYFLNGCLNLIQLDLSPLSNIKSIGNSFLSNCSKLIKLDLSPLSNVKFIGDYFLYSCIGLLELDFKKLTKIQSIGNCFLYYCISVLELDFTKCTKIQSIGHNFLHYCLSLTSVQLSSLSNIKTIKFNFLSNCSNLSEINLSALTNIKFIGDNFLENCSKLTEIDLSALSKIKFIENNFLENCSKLIHIKLPVLSNIKSIGNNFLSNCLQLSEIDLTALSNIKIIRHYFLLNCLKLSEIDLTPLSNVKIIGHNFLSNCSKLSKIDLTPLSKIESIDQKFLYNSISLKYIKCTNLQLNIIQKNNSNFNNNIFRITN